MIPLRRAVALLAGLPTLVVLLGLSACGSTQPMVLHEAVGPWKPGPQPADGLGRLMVYSATRVTMEDDSEYPVHTPYTLYGADQQVLQEVDNRAGLFSQAPVALSLPPGRYAVKALAADAGYVLVPVVIESRQTTVVDLDGTGLPQGAKAGATQGSHWVRLPDGHVVGAPDTVPGAAN